jgi:hypothetical protein
MPTFAPPTESASEDGSTSVSDAKSRVCDLSTVKCPVRDSNPPHRIKSPALYQMS